MDTLKFSVLYTLEDFRRYSFALARRQNRIAALLIIIFIFIFPVYLMHSDTTFSWTTYFIVLSSMFVAAIIFGALAVFIARIRIAKVFKTNKTLRYDLHFEVNESGVSCTSEQGNAIVKWEDVYKVLEDKFGIYILIAKTQGFIVPKRILTDDDISSILKIMEENAQKVKRI